MSIALGGFQQDDSLIFSLDWIPQRRFGREVGSVFAG